MSFGMFEAAVAGDKENEHQKKLAKTRLAQAAAEVDQKLGPFLSKATSKSDYIERVRLAENDFREIVGKYLEGDTGFKAVATKMAGHYVQKVAFTDIKDIRDHVDGLGVKTRKKGDGFTFPAASGATGYIAVRPNGEIVVETLIGGSGGFQSVYAPNEMDLVERWIEKTVGGSYRMSSRRRSSAKNLHMLDDMQVLDGYATVSMGLEEGWGEDEGMTQEDLQEYTEELERRGIDPYNNDVYSSRRRANGETHFVHDNGVVEVFDADAYLREHPDADIVTDGYDGRMWDDSVSTSWTPAPGGRSPFEYDRYSSRRRSNRRRVARGGRHKEATPWEEGSEPQFMETGWGEYLMEYGDYSAAVQEDGSWAVVHNDRVVGEGEGNGDPDDSFGEVEQWFKRNASSVGVNPPGFAIDRMKDNFKSDLGSGRATNLQGETVKFDNFDSFVDGLTYEWSQVDVGQDETGQVIVDTWDVNTGYSDQFVVEASRLGHEIQKTALTEEEAAEAFYQALGPDFDLRDLNDPNMPKEMAEPVNAIARAVAHRLGISEYDLWDAVSFHPPRTARRKRSAGSGYDVYNHPDVGELHVTFYNDGTAVVTSPEVGEVGSLNVMPDDGPEDIEEQLNILVDEVRYASKKTAGEYLRPGDLEDHGAQIFFNQYADSHGIDTYGEDYDRMWNDIKEHVGYDVISADLDTAVEYGELSSPVGSRLQWDLEDFYGFGTGALFSSKRSRRQKQAEWGKERFPGTNEMFERAGWQSTDPEKSEWLSPSGYAMYDGSTGSAYYFDPDDNVSSFYTLEDEEFSDNLPKILTDDEEYQSRLWEY